MWFNKEKFLEEFKHLTYCMPIITVILFVFLSGWTVIDHLHFGKKEEE